MIWKALEVLIPMPGLFWLLGYGAERQFRNNDRYPWWYWGAIL